MNERQLLTRRLQAHLAGRAVPIRSARELCADPPVVFGVATIKIVTEEHVQAVAFGDFRAPPRILARIDPMDRDASDLESFAEFLNEQFDRARRDGVLPRVWLPHTGTLETLDVLGHRYERNETASQCLRVMGRQCRIIAREHRHEGQQVVAVASNVLSTHVATGQSPTDDAHLGRLLAWVNPPAGYSAREAAALRTLHPASGVLPNYPGRRDDARIEGLRRARKRAAGAAREAVEREIRTILESAAREEWALLVEAREAFWSLPMADGALDECVAASKSRVFYALDRGPVVPRGPLPRVRELVKLADSQSLAETARLTGDAALRADAARKGRVLDGTVVAVEQPRPGRKPCVLTIATPQRDLRFRQDDRVRPLGANIVGRVRSVDYDRDTGGSRARVEVEIGVQKERALLAAGYQAQWIRSDGFPLERKLAQLKDLTTPWMLDDTAPKPPALPPRHVGTDLVAVAERHFGGTR